MLSQTVFTAAAVLAAAVPASATLLYVSSYAGNVTTLNLTIPAGAAKASLQTVAANSGCASQPAWLTLDFPNSLLYCLADQGDNGAKGTLAAFKTSQDGILTLLDSVDIIKSPVSAVKYGEGGKGLALAHYSGSSVRSFAISDPSKLSLLESETFTLSRPGTNPSRQDAPHPHQAILDPTGQYVIVPDLGADLVRVFLVNQTSLDMTPVTPLSVAPGSGPRHAAFLKTDKKTFMYVVSELANTVTGFEVAYNVNNTLGFSHIYISSTHGLDGTAPSNNGSVTAAEIQITSDSRNLIVSSRGEASFKIPNFDPTNSTQIPSDPLINFAIDIKTGALTAVQTFPAGGMKPRHFSVNKAGDLVGVGLQNDGRVVVIRRDVKTGLLKDFVASANVPGEVNTVVFNE